MIGTLIAAVQDLAMIIGGVVLLGIGILIVGPLTSRVLYAFSSDEAQDVGDKLSRENGTDAGMATLVTDMVRHEVDELADDKDISYETNNVAQFDWSMGHDLSEHEVKRALKALTDAGFYVHPFPRSPDEFDSDEWSWSSRHVGVWTDHPGWYVESDGEREEIEPDVSEWTIETRNEYTWPEGDA